MRTPTSLDRRSAKSQYICRPQNYTFQLLTNIFSTSHTPFAASLPSYFSEKGYKSPSDAYDAPCQYAVRTDKHYFDWVASNPRLQNALNVVMSSSPGHRGEQWYDFYPVESKLRVNTPSDILLVDIGGNRGHDLARFHARFPSLPGKLILQDLPKVVATATDLAVEIEKMGYDFFTPQPVKGAKAYYLRTVLHDWPDKQARVILQRVREAMSEESVLLINESLMADRGVSLYDAWMDMTMMAVFSSLNRTESQFRELLGEEGFEVVKVWRPSVVVPGGCCLFEAVKR